MADTPVVCQKNESDCYNDGFPVVYVSSLNWSVSTYAEGNSWFFDWVFPLQTEGQKEMSKQKAPRSPSWQVASILAVAVLAAGSVAVGVPVAEAQEGVEKCKYLVAPYRPSKRPALHELLLISWTEKSVTYQWGAGHFVVRGQFSLADMSFVNNPQGLRKPSLKVPPAGFEPATDGVETRCSNPLSYGGR